jgi:hypothetical protein
MPTFFGTAPPAKQRSGIAVEEVGVDAAVELVEIHGAVAMQCRSASKMLQKRRPAVWKLTALCETVDRRKKRGLGRIAREARADRGGDVAEKGNHIGEA